MRYLGWIGYILVFLPLLSGCGRTTLELESIPSNTPAGASVFVVGNFNFWDPGDGNFRMTRAANGKYYLDFPLGWGSVAYKFTRGDWTSVEADGCGHAITDREASLSWTLFHWFRTDTLRHKVYSWEDVGPVDCDKVVFRIRRLPKETPPDAIIHLAGTFNDWNPGDPRYAFKAAQGSGILYLDMPKSNKEIEFKITRGNWETEEVDDNGSRIANHRFVFGAIDTVDMEVSGWIDINPGLGSRDVSFMVRTPMGTPSTDPLFITGNFNNWNPNDPTYKLKKIGPNTFFIRFRKPEGEMEYKFTRGPWGTEEVDVYGNHISNRILRTSADTIRISIPEWLDIPVEQTFTFSREEMNYLMNNPDVIAFPVNPDLNEKSVKFSLKPKISFPTQFYIRVALPSAPNNRNYGISDMIKPGAEWKLVCPEGAIFYACEGPYWNDNRPKEKKVFVVTKEMEGKTLDANALLPPP